MALRAVGRDLRGLMIRVSRAVVVRQVAVYTLTRSALKDAVHMALLAGRLHMRTRQRERGRLMIKARIPVRCRMALRAVR